MGLSENSGLGYLLFDYDGTIHDTLQVYEPALRESFQWLEEVHKVQVPEATRQRIASWLGMNREEMWESFLPELPAALRERAGAMVGERMEARVRAGQSAWYPGMSRMLERLRAQGWRLAVLSNCQASYARTHWETFGMSRWFEHFYDCEAFDYAPKREIIRQLKQEGLSPRAVIGDRRQDLECARAAGCRFIGCLYGFAEPGELDGADALAERPENLWNVLQNVFISDSSPLQQSGREDK